ncbi:MAG: hypothetical protein HYR88_09495 [Verrucomicrobia bacterium]|nr:hypothetical protein [Verrucomicrobiota bacterium]MBI3871361.1 hypothetical protein [Verrucomicrobiota bacterium]
MNYSTAIATCFFLLLAAPMARGAAFTYESDAELTASLDADGDGEWDVIVVDKSSGVRQLGIRQADGGFRWQDPASVGFEGITSLSVGHFDTNSPAEGFAIASPEANRAASFTTPTSASVLVPSFGIGPNAVVAFDFAGDVADDLIVATQWDDPPDATRFAGFQWAPSEWQSASSAAVLAGPLVQANRARFKTDRAWMLAALRPAVTSSEFLTEPYFKGPGFIAGPTLLGLAANTRWAWGEFKTSGFSTFLFYEPGKSTLRAPSISEPFPSTFAWGPGATYDLGSPISQISVLPTTTGALLLAIFNDGAAARTYDFDGVSKPVQRQVFTAPSSTRFSLAGGLRRGDFILLNGASGGQGRSTGYQRWNNKGATHTLAGSGALPAITTASGRANVLLYDGDPLASDAAVFLRAAKAGEWSVQASFTAGALDVKQQHTVTSVIGLGNSSNIHLSLPALSSFGVVPLVNQRSGGESVSILSPASDDIFRQVSFAPTPGTYAASVDLPLVIHIRAQPAAPLYYRTGPASPWLLYDADAPPRIIATTEFTAFAQSNPPSAIQRARYQIAALPGVGPVSPVDANNNGLSDDYEKALGIQDPNGDPDGDGFTNLQEYQAGTDPQDPKSVPSNTSTPVVLIARSPGASAPAETLCEIAWPSNVPGLILEFAVDLIPPVSWTAVTASISTVGLERIYYNPDTAGSPQRFFRLRKGP